MKRVILYTQGHNPVQVNFAEMARHGQGMQGAISSAVITLAESLEVQAIVAETLTGDTALKISSYRPDIPIVAVTSKAKTAHQLALVYATKSYVRPVDRLAATKLTNWLRQTNVLAKGDMVVTASGQYPGVVGTTDTIKVRVLE